MFEPQQKDVESVIQKMVEIRDQALWKVLYFKCQSCGEIKPIDQAVGLEFPPENGNVRVEIWCKSCVEG